MYCGFEVVAFLTDWASSSVGSCAVVTREERREKLKYRCVFIAQQAPFARCYLQ